jgi:signal transduction histidine kinase
VIRRIETVTETKFKMLIVDKKASYVVETKDDTKSKFTDAVGLATLSNSKATILPYVTIFESFWRETDLYERAREADKVKDEFINVAAHELRTPITPIIAGAELMRDTIGSIRDALEPKVYTELVGNANLIIRNAAKLSRLSEDILQVSRIEGGNLVLNLKEVDVDSMILSVISDIELRYSGERSDVRIEFERRAGPPPGVSSGAVTDAGSRLRVYCDEAKISRVLYNLLDNAMKFTTHGLISITTSVSSPDNELVINVKDTGTGLDPAVKARLFEKFSAKSEGGTGLGLYLSRKIVEAHNGRIWAGDRLDGHGASFSFAIPFDTGLGDALIPDSPGP